MRKYIVFIVAFFLSKSVAQNSFMVSGDCYKITDAEGIDAVFVFNGISATSTITYTGTDFVEWQGNDGTFVSNIAQFSPDEGGYRVKTNSGDYFYIWVFDYTNYLVSIADVKLDFGDDKCSNISVIVDFDDNTKKMNYQTQTGEKTLLRKYELTYKTAEWTGGAWVENEQRVEQIYPFTSIAVESPYSNTSFVLKGDQFAQAFGIQSDYETKEYQAIAIKAYPKGIISKRDAKNEIDQTSPNSSGGTSKNCKCKQEVLNIVSQNPNIGGSAPLVVDFKSNVNEDATDFIEWFISDDANPNSKIRYTDKDFRYTFDKAGNYTVRLLASSTECEYMDSIKITVLESFIDVPNVFTPNGDGVNDEFRVVYRSLIEFSASVYNRWGRLVARWTDPAKGWDGRINGKMASPGAYYYVVQAVGADKDKDGKNIEWKCSGDINLLRGKK